MTDGVVLDLREGFFGDDVVVRASGRVLRLEHDVTTRVQTGLARSLPLPVETGAQQITLEVPGLRLLEEVALPDRRPMWIGMSLVRDRQQLEVLLREEPWGYL